MNKKIYFIFLLLCALPLAFGTTLNVSSTGSEQPIVNRNYNSSTLFDVMVLNLSANESSVNITSINFTITGSVLNGTYGNISEILLYNGANVIGSELLENESSENDTVLVHINNGFVVNTTPEYITVKMNITPSATTGITFGINLTSNTSITTDNSSDLINGSFPMFSGNVEIANLHATAEVSPHYVDTNVANQTLTYTIKLLPGTDNVKEIHIIFPDNFTVENVTLVKTGPNEKTIDYETSCSSNVSVDHVCLELGQETNITFSGAGVDSSSENSTITVKFLADTPSSSFGGRINSTIDDSFIPFTTNTTCDGNSTMINVKQLIKVSGISAIKNRAFANGKDYWEFNLTINITENVTGLLQMRMDNWTDDSGKPDHFIAINGNALIYESGHTDRNSTVGNSYANGISFTNAVGEKNIILKMTIPQNTSQTSYGWWTKFWMLFRTE